MKVITDDRLIEFLSEISQFTPDEILWLADNLSAKLEEIDTLTVNETDLISAAEKYAEIYDGDDRQDIKTDVLNAFYHGADWQRKKELTGDGDSELSKPK